MCRLLGYLGKPIAMESILLQPEHSLMVQSYAPKEMKVALMNADGFGVGWYHADRQDDPYTYKNILPMWNDTNLPSLSRYVESGCMVAYVRSATPGLAVDLSNCQPFVEQQVMFTHNGYIKDFRTTLRRSLRQRLSPYAENWIKGTTDSEYLCALILTYWEENPEAGLEEALVKTLHTVEKLAQDPFLEFAATLVISTPKRLIGCRYANFDNIPTLYTLQNPPQYPQSVILASEPLFEGNWEIVNTQSLITVGENENGEFEIHQRSI